MNRHFVLPLTLVLFFGLNIAFLTYTRPTTVSDFKSYVTLNQQIPESILDTHKLDHDTQPPLSPPQTVLTTALSPVVFAMVMFGADSATEGLLALKSALMHVSRPAEFHIICSPDAVPIVQEKLDLFSRPFHDVRLIFYPLSDEDVKTRAERAGVGSRYSAGLGGLVKAFIHDLLYDVDKVIFYDTDMLFLVDPYVLWHEFDHMSGEQMIAFPTLGPQSGTEAVCTCVMLLNLKRMRETNFMPSSLIQDSSASTGAWSDTGIDPLAPDFGDQGLYWAIWKWRPERFMHLSLSWDLTHCRYSYGLSLADGDDSMSEEDQIAHQEDTRFAPERNKQLFPGIVHFNCQPDFSVVWRESKNSLRPRWGPFVQIAIQYKWVWLNRGDDSAQAQSKIVTRRKGALWWDEILSTGPLDSGLSSGKKVSGHKRPKGGHS